ncbi:MAG: hypothetical protein V4558_09410 [Gemmatimonadota bacterium]
MFLLALVLFQQVPTVRLDRPTAAPKESFTEITGLVELPDGRLLVADQSEHRLVRLDPRSSEVTPLSHQGAGPREFRAVSHLFPRPGGGAWLTDFAQRRLLPINADGSLADVVAVPPSLLLAAVDASGRIYADLFGKFANGKAPDSMTVVRWTPPASGYDTLMLRNANWSTRTGRPRHALAPYDASVVLASGDVVTLDAAHYRFERWHDGTRIASAMVPWTPIPMTAEEKRAYIAAESAQKSRSFRNGKAGSTAPGAPPPNWLDGIVWPTNKPAFVDDDVYASSDARIWLRRYTAFTDSTPRYDVLDDAGRLVGRVTLRTSGKVVGFGKGVVYIGERNDDDELQIRRYPLPAF